MAKNCDSRPKSEDTVGELVGVYSGRLPGDVSGRVTEGAAPLTSTVEALLEAQNQPQARQAIRRAFEASPTELAQAAVSFAAKKR